MKGAHILIVAVIAVLVILLAYAVAEDLPWSKKNYWTSNYIDDPWRVYQRSAGDFDDAAQLALERANGRDEPTPGDHILAATIITRNILDREHLPTRDATGAPTRAARERTNLRRGLFGDAREHFMAALNGLRNPPRNGGRNPYDANTGFIIDAATNFAFGGLTNLIANDPIAAQTENITVINLDELLPMVDQPLAQSAADRRAEKVSAQRTAARDAAKEQGGARGVAVDAYVGLATQHTDDPQNAHDPGVLACFRGIVARLRKDQDGQTLPTTDEITSDIVARGADLSEGRAHRVKDVLEVVERTKKEERVVAIGATDKECLQRVWLRCSDPRNVAVRNQLRQAIFDALYDAWEEGIDKRKIMCVNGRTTRILSSLVLIDWDTRNWEVKKLEQFKNDIYARAAAVIRSEAEKAAQSSDPGLQKAGQSYLVTSEEDIEAVNDVPEQAEEALANTMREAIREMVDAHISELENEHGIKNAIPTYMVDAVKEEAVAAVV